MCGLGWGATLLVPSRLEKSSPHLKRESLIAKLIRKGRRLNLEERACGARI
jgi:hypothetical protein